MRRRRLIGLAALIVAVLLLGRFVAALVVDYRWYAALGPGPLAVWRAQVTDIAALRSLLVALGGAFVFANLAVVSSSVESLVLPRRLGDLEIGETVAGRELLWVAAIVALAAGAALSLLVGDWMAFDLVQFAPPLGLPEPYTGADAGFYVYWLPLENEVYIWAIVTLLATATAVSALYALTAGLRWQNGRVLASRHVRRHLLMLIAALLLMLAWAHRLDGYSLLHGGSGVGGAFGYVDHRVALRARFALAAVTAIAALLMVNAAWHGSGRLAFWVITAVLGSTIVLRGAVPFVATRAIGRAALAERDGPYLRNRAAMSQTAFGVNRIQIVPEYTLGTVDAAAEATPTWDPVPLARSIERARRGEVADDVIGWQPFPSELGAVAITHAATGTDAEPTSWTAVVVSATAVDARGEPVGVGLATAGRSPTSLATSTTAALAADERHRRFVSFPRAAGYAIVGDSTGRIVGDPIGGTVARLVHAWNERDFRLLFSDALDRMPSPVIVLRRDVRERLDAVAPFFAQGYAIAPLVVRDTVHWVCHLYAASADFPLSQRYDVGGGVYSYYQHAAIGVVNAETGAVTLVADSAPDRLTAVWTARFPALFSSRDALGPELGAALPPPTDGAMLQAWTLARFGRRGLSQPRDVHVPAGEGSDSTLGVATRALSLMPTQRHDAHVTGWTLPLVDGSDRVAGLVIALGGVSPATLWVPAAADTPPWTDVNGRMRAAVADWTSRLPGESAAERPEFRTGQLRALPLAGRSAFVKPLYAVRPGGGPTVVGAVATIDDEVRIGATIREALSGVASPAASAPALTASSPALGDRARSLYERMREAMRRGDWSAFGAAFDSLGAALARTAAPR